MTSVQINRKRVVIGLVLYLIVLVISNLFNPWETYVQQYVQQTEPSFISKVFDLFFYGIADTKFFIDNSEELFVSYYVDRNLNVYNSTLLTYVLNPIFFICFNFAACHLFQAIVIKRGIMNVYEGVEEHEVPLVEKLLVGFFYDNIFSYIACIVTSLFLSRFYDSAVAYELRDLDPIVRLIVVFIIAFLFLIPTVPYGGYYLSYTYIATWAVALLNYMNTSMGMNAVFKNIIIFVVAAICLIVFYGLIVNLILDKLLDLSDKLIIYAFGNDTSIGCFKIFGVMFIIALIVTFVDY